MILVATSPLTPKFTVTTGTLKENNFSALKIIKPQADVGYTEIPLTQIPPQEITAGMAFYLFGLGAQLGNCASKRLPLVVKNATRYIQQIGFNDSLIATGKAIKFFQGFIRVNKVAEQGEILKNIVSDYPSELTASSEDEEVISFSKVLNDKELIIAYNTDEAEPKVKFILIHNNTGAANAKIKIVFGYESCGYVHVFNSILKGANISYIKVYLKPLQLVILKNFDDN